MKHPRKRLWRTASQIYERLVAEEPPSLYALPFQAWWRCDRLLRLRQRAQCSGWESATLRLERELKSGLAQLIQQLTSLHGVVSSDSPQQQVSSVRDLYAELLALEEEFGELQLDLREQSISVCTGPIELEGVYLGPFEIRLNYSF